MTIINFLIAHWIDYLVIGFIFSTATWLACLEDSDRPSQAASSFIFFTLFWPIIILAAVIDAKSPQGEKK